jgi:hypothetical protein
MASNCGNRQPMGSGLLAAQLVFDGVDPDIRLHRVGRRVFINVSEHTLWRVVEIVDSADINGAIR